MPTSPLHRFFRPRLLAAAPLLVAVACAQAPSSPGTSTSTTSGGAASGNATTSVGVGDTADTGTIGTGQGSNGNTAATNGNVSGGSAAATNGNVSGGSAASLAGMTLAPGTAVDLCLAAQSSPPAAGDAIVLRSCAVDAAQRWIAEAGRLRTGDNLCLVNPAAKVQLASAAVAGDANLVPTLAACDSNMMTLRQHVTVRGGAIFVGDGASEWALSTQGTASLATRPVWLQYDPNDVHQQWRAGQATHDANMQLAYGAFAVSVTGDAATWCLDSNAQPAGGSRVIGTAACDPNAASQRWSLSNVGSLGNQGSCLLANGNDLSMGSCDNQATRWGQFTGYGQLSPNSAYQCLAAQAAGGAVNLALCSDAAAGLWSFGRAP